MTGNGEGKRPWISIVFGGGNGKKHKGDVVLDAVVYSWLMLVVGTGVAVILSLFMQMPIPSLDVLERVIGWTGAVSLMIIKTRLDAYSRNQSKDTPDEDNNTP